MRMCEVGAACPNCGQPELDADERSCITLDDNSYREYLCRRCGASIQVNVKRRQEQPPPPAWHSLVKWTW